MHVLDTSHFTFIGAIGKHVLDFSKVWIDDGGSVKHFTHDRKAFKTFSLFDGTMRVGSGWTLQGWDQLNSTLLLQWDAILCCSEKCTMCQGLWQILYPTLSWTSRASRLHLLMK